MKEKLSCILNKNKNYYLEGKVADYIPKLSEKNPQDLGLGFLYHGEEILLGDYKEKFTIQSISKVFTYLLLLNEMGEKVDEYLGCEGTDDGFNRFYKLEALDNSIPANPCLNAGAILTSSLIEGKADEKIEKILDFFRLISKNPDLNYNDEIYKSEKSTGYRNIAMANLLESKGLLGSSVEESLDTYFKQCSIEVTVEDLMRMGEFIMTKGASLDRNIIKKKEYFTRILAIMNNSGMYDYSGRYSIDVGIPSKSGVGGGILGVVPGKAVVVSYSPPLDSRGNSLVGLKVLEDISKEFNLNIFA